MDIIYSIATIAVVIVAIVKVIYKVASGDGGEVLERLFEKTEQNIKYVIIFLFATVLLVLDGRITWLSAIITAILVVIVAIGINIVKESDSVTLKLIVYGICWLIIGYLTFCALLTWFLVGWGKENINLIGILF